MFQLLELRNFPGALRSSWLCWRATCLAIIGLAFIPSGAGAEPRTLTNDWSFLIRYPCDSSPAIAADGTIYLGIWNGDLRAFRPDGSSKWVFHASREIKSCPAIGADGTVYFGCRDRKFYAVGPEGKEKWEFKTGAWIDSSAAIGAEGRIYFGSHDRNFYALSPEGGKLWAFATGGPILSSAAIDRDGTLYFTSVDGSFYALNSDGTLKWRLRTGGITASSPVIDEQGAICVGVNTKVWIISRQGAKQRELAFSPGYIETSPLALADGSICFTSGYGYVANFDSQGQCNWFFPGGYGSFTSCPGPHGVIYTVKQVFGEGTYFCALPTAVPLAHSAWPKLCGTLQNNGRSQPQ